jgi:site-specific DNA recombinase
MPSTNGHGSKATTERVALYLRVSSEEQRDRETIEIQREFLEQYRSLYDLEVAEMYADDGVSGTIPLHERPEGRRLLEDAKEGKVQIVLVYKLDRLGRSLLVIVDAHDRLQEAGVALRSATEPIDTSTPSGRLIFQMLASFAEFDRESIRERTQAGLHRAARNGKHMGPVPFGYRASKNGHLEVIEEEAEIVRQIYANTAGGSTLNSEAQRLNALGIYPPSWKYASTKKPATQWRAPSVRNVVRQRVYSGVHEVTLSTGEVVEQRVPAIVTPELQQVALARLEENRRYSGGRRRRRYLLRGLITCAECGCTCVGRAHTARGRDYAYYKCNDDRASRAHRTSVHNAPYVNASWLEATVWSDVRRFVENPGEVIERIRAQKEGDDATTQLEARHADLETRFAARHKERDRWLHLYAQGHISEDELEIYLADLRTQLDNLKLFLSSVDEELAARREEMEVAETAEAWLLTLRERVGEVEEDTEEAFGKRRQLVKLLVAGITAGRDEDGNLDVRITYRFGPPEPAHEEELFVGGVQSFSAFLVPIAPVLCPMHPPIRGLSRAN